MPPLLSETCRFVQAADVEMKRKVLADKVGSDPLPEYNFPLLMTDYGSCSELIQCLLLMQCEVLKEELERKDRRIQLLQMEVRG